MTDYRQSENDAAVAIDECTSEHERQRWNAYLAAHPAASFYHRYEWKALNEREFGHDCRYLVAQRNGRLCGVLPLVFVSSRIFGRILCSMPFVNFGGPCADDAAAQKALLERAMAIARELECRYLELRSTSELDIGVPAALNKISMVVKLESDPEQLWKGFTSKHRNNIRRAYKNDLTVQSGGAELLDEFYGIMELSWRQLGTPLYSKRYFAQLLATFGDSMRIFVCRCKDEPIAVTLNGHHGDTVEGMWAGGKPATRGLDANYALYWEMMQDACKRGFRRFHLGRSTAGSGAQQFKEKWNAEMRQLYWYFYDPAGSAPKLVNVQNPKYQLAIRMWRRLPLWATRVGGPPLARLIP